MSNVVILDLQNNVSFKLQFETIFGHLAKEWAMYGSPYAFAGDADGKWNSATQGVADAAQSALGS